MAKTTIKLSNGSKPAPRWFRKTKRALTILADTAVIMMLSMGFAENSFIMLWCRVGLSGVLLAFEAILANGEDYVDVSETEAMPPDEGPGGDRPNNPPIKP